MFSFVRMNVLFAHTAVLTTAVPFFRFSSCFSCCQVSGVKKNVKEEGDIWVVAKTLKAFNRLRVAWEEDYGTTSIPVEPPPARWADCSETDWVSFFFRGRENRGGGGGGGSEQVAFATASPAVSEIYYLHITR